MTGNPRRSDSRQITADNETSEFTLTFYEIIEVDRPPALEAQSSVSFAVGTVPDVMRQSLSGEATFRIRIVPSDSSVPITSALAVTAT
jgi:hypothetical protein